MEPTSRRGSLAEPESRRGSLEKKRFNLWQRCHSGLRLGGSPHLYASLSLHSLKTRGMILETPGGVEDGTVIYRHPPDSPLSPSKRAMSPPPHFTSRRGSSPSCWRGLPTRMRGKNPPPLSRSPSKRGGEGFAFGFDLDGSEDADALDAPGGDRPPAGDKVAEEEQTGATASGAEMKEGQRGGKSGAGLAAIEKQFANLMNMSLQFNIANQE
eukprot:785274-Prorocentrum_minimum.AAC.1